MSGTIRLLANGNGSLIPEDNRLPPIKMFPEEINGVFNGDRLLVSLDQERSGKLKGRLIEMVERGPGILVGTLWRKGKDLIVHTHPAGIEVHVDDPGSHAKTGHAVVLRLKDKTGGRKRGLWGDITEILGAPSDPSVQVEMAILGNGLTLDYPQPAVLEAEAIGEVEPAEVLRGSRRDLRDVLHVTIDGADARDFDDAVSCRFEDGSCRVWVSIADVSAYVVEGTALDDEAHRRGTSVYFPHKAVHMLPTELSTGLCSLNPHVPRLTMTVEMLVNSSGVPEEVSVYSGLIQSGGRLTYEEVEEALGTSRATLPDDNPCKQKSIYSLLKDLSKVSGWFRKQRTDRGAVDFELGERKVIVDEAGHATHIEERARLGAHRLIEDLMIAANEAVATYLLNRDWPTVFRIHERPDPEAFGKVAKWAETFGYKFDAQSVEDPRRVAEFARELGKDDRSVIGQILLLRSMKQARYSIENFGHFGLASEAYLHFTSPIRRYPDLLVHRSLKKLIAKEGPLKDLESSASHASVQERAAVLAERDVTDLMSCQIAADFIGDEMDAQVVAVLPFGVFVRAKEALFEGAVPIELFNDYFHENFEYVEESITLLGRLTGRRITFGTELKVRLESVNGALRRIDFALCGAMERKKNKGSEGAGKNRSKAESSEGGRKRRSKTRSSDAAPKPRGAKSGKGAGGKKAVKKKRGAPGKRKPGGEGPR